jgi:hypothetical protein
VSEALLQASVIKNFKRHNFMSVKIVGVSHRGVPDLLVMGPHGTICFIEVKNPNGKGALSRLQKLFKREVEQRGIHYYLISNYEEMNHAIERELDRSAGRLRDLPVRERIRPVTGVDGDG